MQHYQKTLFGLFLGLFAASMTSTISAETLDILRKRHNVLLRKVGTHRQEQVREHNEVYLNAIKNLLKKEREAGNLERTMTLMMVVDQFDKKGTVSNVLSEDVEVKKLQEGYLRILGRCRP